MIGVARSTPLQWELNAELRVLPNKFPDCACSAELPYHPRLPGLPLPVAGSIDEFRVICRGGVFLRHFPRPSLCQEPIIWIMCWPMS